MVANFRGQQDVADQMAAVRARFIGTIDGRLAELRGLVAGTDGPDAVSRELTVRRLHRRIHDMRGCAGMVGLADLDALVRKALPLVQEADLQGRDLSDEERDILNAAFDRIEELAERTDVS